ncbi:hybrid sensor histidine kinase/response regulator [Enterovibrio coralii]|uniref:histidine kinase n=1 Tax=Enterovibrio coralii TaxID=294935 RepID=A0A135I5E1_9GAMM|nr:ATP-binding protein [Enterovibrio coralii]KXF80663.1 hybrid sensor histidine kinase/response regulator [Enterovibrio coralii]
MHTQSIRPRLMMTLSALLLLTSLMAAISLYTLWQNQHLLEDVTTSTLADTQTSLILSENVAQIAAVAPYIATSARPFQVQKEKAKLTARIDTLVEHAAELSDPRYAAELSQRVDKVSELLAQLMGNVERELYIREDLLAQQFNLEPLQRYRFGRAFIAAYSQNPTYISQGWIDNVSTLFVERSDTTHERHMVMPVFASLSRGLTHVNELRNENAFLLASIRAQSDRMAEYVNTIVSDHRESVSLQQTLAKQAITHATLVMAGILISLMAGVFYLFLFNNKMATDLEAVTDEMLNLAKGDTAITPVKLNRQDEIGQLANAFSAFQRNAIDKVHATQALYRQKTLLETLFNEMQDGLSAYDANTKLLAWNSSYAALLGIDESKLYVGMPITSVQALLPKTLSTTEDPTLAIERQSKPLSFERQFIDGRIVEYRSQPIPSGGFITLYRDLTEKRQLDLQLRHAQKMETLGQLTGGIAHDFNNLLSALSGNLELLSLSAPLSDQNRVYLNRALTVTEKGSQLIERLLAFSRRKPLHPEAVDLEDTLLELQDLLDYTLEGASLLSMDLDKKNHTIFVDKSGLESALMNLLINANAAMPEGGTVKISTHSCTLIDSGKAGVVIDVSDTGVGIPEHLLSKVMEPFFTTKDKGQGSGLGLSMVYGFVEQSQGHIDVQSKLNKGTQFTLIMPIADSDSPNTSRSDSASGEDIASLAGMTVLLVEDDENVASPLIDLMKLHNIKVNDVKTAEDAIKYCDSVTPDVVISDINLGDGMTGTDLKKALMVSHPTLPILLMSGLPKSDLIAHYGFEPDWVLITKPIIHHQLLKILSDQNSKR